MKFSIITINLNNVDGLKKTIESVVQQTFTDFEYIIIDGKSRDRSIEIIAANADKFSYWVSEVDTGVYHAMNKGIKKATGEYLLFLNSGDHLMDNKVLEEVSSMLSGKDIVYGNLFFTESNSKSWIGVYPDKLSFQHFLEGSLPHPGSFIKRSVFDKVGFYDESLKIVADWKFFLDGICRFNISYKHINKTIAVFYLHGLSSLPMNQALLQEEKSAVFNKDYPLFIENSRELAKLRIFKNSRVITKFVKLAKVFGLLKNY